MKKALILGLGILSLIVVQSVMAQQNCKRVHQFCTNNLPEEEQAELWSFNNQSKSATFEKGKTYEMSFIAYRDYIYRLSTCTDVLEGGDKIEFEILHLELTRKEVNGVSRLMKEKTSIYNNKEDEMKPFHKFRVEKTEKLFVRVKVPSSGESSNKKFKDSEFICVGVLLEQRKGEKIGF